MCVLTDSRSALVSCRNPQNIPLDGLSIRKLGGQHSERGSDVDPRFHDDSPLLPMAHSAVGLGARSLHTAQLRGQSHSENSLNACERKTIAGKGHNTAKLNAYGATRICSASPRLAIEQ